MFKIERTITNFGYDFVTIFSYGLNFFQKFYFHKRKKI